MAAKDEQNDVGEPRIVTRPERNAATSFRDNASGPPKENENITDRPNDYEVLEHQWALENSTLAGRAQTRKRNAKQVDKDADEVEDKKVTRASTKRAKKS